jgi:hypothetical protein
VKVFCSLSILRERLLGLLFYPLFYFSTKQHYPPTHSNVREMVSARFALAEGVRM